MQSLKDAAEHGKRRPKNIFLFVSVRFDGFGDYKHFEDIMLYMRRELSTSVDLIPVIKHELFQEKRIIQSLINMGLVQHYLITNQSNMQKFISTNSQLQNQLADSVAIIQISIHFSELDKFLPYISKQATMMHIDEHERTQIMECEPTVPTQLCMGLGPGRAGIKISNSKNEATSLQDLEHPLFKQLLLRDQSEQEFKENNFLSTAYSNSGINVMRYILFLASNDSIRDKNISILSSAKGSYHTSEIEIMEEHLTDSKNNNYLALLKKTGIKEVFFIDGSNEPTQEKKFTINPEGTRTFTVFRGFWLNDADYSRVFENSHFPMVTGDNSFEMSIAKNKVPYYVPTYFREKLPSIKGLLKIINELAGQIDDKALHDLNIFFNINSFFQYADAKFDDYLAMERNNTNVSKYLLDTQTLDLIKLSAVWPLICEKVKIEHNFYDVLKAHLYKILPKEYFVTMSKKEEGPSIMSQNSLFFDYPSQKTTTEKKKTDSNPTVK